METNTYDQLQAKISKDSKRSLKIYCAVNNLTISQGVELALSKLNLPNPQTETNSNGNGK